MSAKSLGTLPVIYAVDELQNPLPQTTMLFEGDSNNRTGVEHCMGVPKTFGRHCRPAQ